MSNVDFKLTGNSLRDLVKEILSLTYAEFSRYCGKSHHVWLAQQVAREDKQLPFPSTARAFLGYLNYRYQCTQEACHGLSEEDANAIKAHVFDTVLVHIQSIVNISMDADPNVYKRNKKAPESE